MDDFADPTATPQTGVEAVPPPPPSQAESADSTLAGQAAPSSSMIVNIRSNTAGQTTIAGVLNQFVPDDARSFSAEMASAISKTLEEELLHLVTIDNAHAEKLLGELEQHRVLLLAGDRRTGKATTAKYLATRIAEAHDLKYSTCVVDPLERQVRIIVRKLGEHGERVTIFSDALAKRNRDLIAFFSADRAAWEQLSETLRGKRAYLIFTAAAVDLDPIRARLSGIVAHDLPPLPRELIAAGVDSKLAWLKTAQSGRAERLRILNGARERLVRELKTLPNIIGFIDDFVRSEDDLETALGRWSAPTYCFLNDLANDADAWCCALTLALTEAKPKGEEPVSWSDFETLRRAITEHIRADSEIFPRRRFRPDQDNDEAPERTAGASLADDALVERCRIKVGRDRRGFRDVVCFEDASHIAAVWETVLAHNRRVLTAIVPLLREIAENKERIANLSLRMLAAQMIGRIGAIDPTAIALPLIEREWTGSRDLVMRPLVGCLLQGVLASGNERYQLAGLRALEEMASADAEQLDDEGRDRLLTAVAAYSQLGDYAPAKAMERLGDIAIEHCAPFMAEVQVMFMLAEKAERDRSSVSRRRAEMLRARGRGLGRRANRILARQAPMLAALEQALVYLCLMNEPVEILTSTRDWISRGGSSAGMLVTTLFLREGGIADRLEEFAADVDSEAGKTKVSPLILSAASSRESLRALCGFLADLHGSINSAFSLPVDVQRGFQERFAACLAMWARGAATVAPYREAVEDLFVALAAARGGALRREIYLMIGEATFADGEPTRSFATAVRKRIGS